MTAPNTESDVMDLRGVALLEERRLAVALEETAAEARVFGVQGADGAGPAVAGVMCRGEPGLWINYAVNVGLHTDKTGPVTRAQMDALIAFYAEKGIEPRIEITPFIDDSLRALLAELGFVVRQFESVFFRPLSRGEIVPPCVPTPADVALVKVDPANEDELMDCGRVVLAGFLPPGQAPTRSDFDLFFKMSRHPRTVTIAAKVDGRVVGCGAMEVGGEVGALFGAVVAPEQRKRGVQQALLAARLTYLAADGARVATISSRPGVATERNCQRLGFRLGYMKLAMVRPGAGLAPVYG